jgi:cbb3-type cytochrome oxidase maturation protein
MNALMYLIPIALTLGVAGLFGFFWAMRNGQFEDLDGAPHRMLQDDESEGETPTRR